MFPGCTFHPAPLSYRPIDRRVETDESSLHLGFYLLGMWYKRSEAQKRFSFFFSSTSLAGAFGGLLASGLGKLEGVRGYSGWRWVFIVEGLLTCVVAIALFFLLPGFPEDVKWLSEEEREFVKAKLAKDVGSAGTDARMGWREVLEVFKDCRFGCLKYCATEY